MQDFQDSMPILWSYSLGNDGSLVERPSFPFPPAIGGQWAREISGPSEAGLLNRQVKKLKADWDIVSSIFPYDKLPQYTYYWLIVNTRSFYFELPEAKNAGSHDDRMVLCPFIDYFNHNDHGVSH